MVSTLTDKRPGIDVEAQQVPPLVTVLEEEMRERKTDETKVDASRAPPLSTNQGVEALLTISQATGTGDREIYMTRIHPSEYDDPTPHALAQAEQGDGQAERTDTEHEVDLDPVTDNQTDASSPHSGNGDQEPQEIRMIGDFDSGAKAPWIVYRDEAKSYDEAHVQTLKDAMDRILIFAGLFSASLTSFVIDSKKDLKVNPADQMAFYLQQNVVMLNQISQQISSISPQFSIPLSPPPPYPTFRPLSSDVRVNVFWSMSLIFSLSATLLAILVQQWFRDYMHVFQRYSDPLKSARLRRYWYEGCEKWYMPVVAEAVPGLLHVSLFLFFIGLGDFILGINTTVGLYTAFLIGFSGLLYIFTMFGPVIWPRSPYQNSFAALIRYLTQRLHGRTYKDQGVEGASQPSSPIMSQGRMQLAMEGFGENKGDDRTIRWLVDNLTEDAETELFVVATPGSINAEWGLEVRKGISEVNGEENKITNRNEITAVPFPGTYVPSPTPLSDQAPPRATIVRNFSDPISRPIRACAASSSSTGMTVVPPVPGAFSDTPAYVTGPSQGETVVRVLSRRVAQLLDTCKNRGLFANDEQWRRRTRACIETTASLVGCADAELGWFGDVGRLLGDIGSVEKTGELLSTGMDRSFVTRWMCLSIMAIRPVLSGNIELQSTASDIVSGIQWFREEQGTPDEQALTNAQKIDDAFNGAWNCLLGLFSALFHERDLTKEEVEGTLHNHEYLIIELERIYVDAGSLTWVDQRCTFLLRHMNQITHGITAQLPGVQNKLPTVNPIPFTQVLELFAEPLKFPIIPPGRALQSFCSLAPRFRDILEGQGVEESRETLMSLKAIEDITNRTMCPLQRQLWRLQDLRDGGGLGFIVELFFLALKQLLSTSLSQESQSALYIGTFRAITSDWSSYKHSLGTQKILLDAVASEDGTFSGFNYPAYITDEFFLLLENLLDKQSGPHIDTARRQLQKYPPWDYQGSLELRAKALKVISQSQIATVSAPLS